MSRAVIAVHCYRDYWAQIHISTPIPESSLLMLGLRLLNGRNRPVPEVTVLIHKTSKNDSLTMGAHKPSIVIEQASPSYSFRFPELSQSI